MALVDYEDILAVASSGFFVVLAFGLLWRYRRVSQKLRESTDLGRDLWEALETRMKKQDERILDMSTRLEVLQSRVLSESGGASGGRKQEKPATRTQSVEEPREDSSVGLDSVSHQLDSKSHDASGDSSGARVDLDQTQMTAIKLLSVRPMNTRELTDALRKSREHTARIMKMLFDMELVVRNVSEKPFVYELTAKGRSVIG